MKKVVINQNEYSLVERRSDKYIVRWNPTVMLNLDCTESDKYVVCEQVFDRMPTLFDIKEEIDSVINAETDLSILQGFRWNNEMVWLSLEDQINYKGAYDLCVQTQGQGVLPLTIKIGYSTKPVYATFNTVAEFSQFYIAMFTYIQTTLAAGWQRKDSVDYQAYDTALRELAAAEHTN